MTALDKNPQTTNLLSPLGYTFYVQRSPNVNFHAQYVDIPGFSLPAVNEGTPFVTLPQVGDHIAYEQLKLTFAVDENLNNYTELYSWIKNTGFPDDFAQHGSLSTQPDWTGGGLKSEILVTLLNSAKNANVLFTFHDAFPTAISGFSVSSTETDVKVVLCTCVFDYSSFDIGRVT